MARLVLRRSFFERIEALSVVYLAIAYAVLSIALAVEWGRALSGMAFAADDSATPSTVAQPPTGGLP